MAKINQVNGLPKIPDTPSYDFSRGHFLDGTLRTYFAPGQTPLSTVSGLYEAPIDWAKENTLLRVPKMLWISLNFGTIHQLPPPVPNSVLKSREYQYKTFTVEAHDNYDTYGHAFEHVNSYQEYLPLDQASPIDTYETIDPQQNRKSDKYLSMKASLLALVQSIPALSLNKARAILIDYTVFHSLNGSTLGNEVIADTGATYNLQPNNYSDLWLSELISPPLDQKYFGVNFLHIHVGLHNGYNLPDQTSASRLSRTTIYTEAAKFSKYSTRFVGLERGFVPVRETVDVSTSGTSYGGAFNDVFFSPKYGSVTHVFDSPTHINTTFESAVPFSQFITFVHQSDYDDAYNTASDLYVEIGRSNDLLLAEALSLVMYDFAYLGDTSSVSISQITSTVTTILEL